MTFVSVLEARRTPAMRSTRLTRDDVLYALRNIALDLDRGGAAEARFTSAIGSPCGNAAFDALRELVLLMCARGRRTFVVGHPRSSLPTPAERHMMALIAAAQDDRPDEMAIRLATLLPVHWQADARACLAALARGLARAGVIFEAVLAPPPPRSTDWPAPLAV